jgi:hypothetical protein
MSVMDHVAKAQAALDEHLAAHPEMKMKMGAWPDPLAFIAREVHAKFAPSDPNCWQNCPPVKTWTTETAFEQIRKCGYTCEGGPLENNDAWRWIRQQLTETP